MSQGRRTASLKASIEAVNAGIPTIREFSIGKDLATNAGLLSSASPTPPPPYTQDISRSGRPRKQSTRLPQSVVQPQPVIPQPVIPQPQPVQPEPLTLSDDCIIEGVVLDEAQTHDWTYDPNEPRYCICNQVSYGDMVACDNEDCPFEWFHYPCVGISQPPKGKWYCPQCLSSMRRRGRKEK